MTVPGLPPNVRVIVTAEGVCYRFNQATGNAVPLCGLLAALAAVPVAAGVVAVLFLVRHCQELPWPLLALGGLFPAQMAFLARWPLKFLAQWVWQGLVGALGHRDLEVRGGWLALVTRVGPVRRRDRRRVSGVVRLTVYVYEPQFGAGPGSAPPAGTPREYACLAAECDGAPRWLLVDGLARAEAVALAEDLNGRLAVAETEGSLRGLPPVAVVETTQDALYPGAGGPGPPLLRRLWWLAWDLAGCVGLGALWFAAQQTTDWENSRTRLCLFAAGFVEVILLVATLKWPGRSAGPAGKE